METTDSHLQFGHSHYTLNLTQSRLLIVRCERPTTDVRADR